MMARNGLRAGTEVERKRRVVIYNALRNVLTAVDEQGYAEHDDWEDLIADRLPKMSASYQELTNPNRELIDYSDLASQAAYLFRYAFGHADYTRQLFGRVREKIRQPIFRQAEINVVSLGGGPGSELLGLMSYICEADSEPIVRKINYTVLDKEVNWEHACSELADSLGKRIGLEVRFENCDIGATRLTNASSVETADLVMASFFISEVCCLPEGSKAKRNIETLLDTMRAGSWMFYNDSDAYSFYSYFNDRTRRAGRFKQILEVKEELQADIPNLDGVFEEYEGAYDHSPRVVSKALSKMLRRT